MVATAHGVTERTVLNWMRGSGETPRPLGRPRRGAAERRRALYLVARARRVQGRGAGERPIWRSLEGRVPLGLVREVLALFKAREDRRRRGHLSPHRMSVRAQVRHAVWSADETHLCRDASGDKVTALALKERAALEIPSLSVGPPATADDVLVLLRAAKSQCGTLPLVLATDNGSIFCDRRVQEYLEEERVMHLRNRVRTPQDNGAAERGIAELKVETGLGRGVRGPSAAEAALLAGKAALLLNTGRLRASHGYRTAQAVGQTLPAWYTLVDRDRFYEEASRAVEEAVKDKTGRRARQAERAAIHATMVKYGLVTMTRGGTPRQRHRRERIL